VAVHEAAPDRLRTWAVDYADERLVARARRLVGVRHAASSHPSHQPSAIIRMAAIRP
jgi:hypothetical protein